MEAKRSAENILGHELIGLHAEIERGNARFSGKIVWETKNCIEMELDSGKTAVLPKKESMIGVAIGKKRAAIDGKLLAYRPEDRTRIFAKKYSQKISG